MFAENANVHHLLSEAECSGSLANDVLIRAALQVVGMQAGNGAALPARKVDANVRNSANGPTTASDAAIRAANRFDVVDVHRWLEAAAGKHAHTGSGGVAKHGIGTEMPARGANRASGAR
jgi:hypothetical protein